MRKLLLVLLAALLPPAAYGQCAYALSGVTSAIDNINLVQIGTQPAGANGNVGDAMNIWAYSCDGYGAGYPLLTAEPYKNTFSTMNVYLVYNQGASTDPSGRCGVTDVYVDQATGAISGATINMWAQQANGADCTATWANLVGHEIGHVLGLGDVDYDANCNGTIMGSNPSYVSSDQCNLVNFNWYTPTEQQADDNFRNNELCSMSCWTACVDGVCGTAGCGSCSSPILLDLDSNGFHLVGLDAAIPFDINADGQREMISWTRGDSEDAFLALDRNHNGRIDNGAELFGNHTRMSNGRIAPNGYEALKEFDLPGMGGNVDGAIDAGDAVWAFLRVWIDRNHDGLSQPAELLSMRDAGIVAIDTGYQRSNREDEYGNKFRFRSRVMLENVTGKPRESTTYDVFFLKR